ncbi:Epoxide hydrolase A [Fusarium oxysporum f. sp. raphani]|uniref:Epoxide hydrolase A n=1 Tax=Fusarium oxysporum f. sp. raphani TaxID=96318 RepID=A0A8J5P1K0_FUSOX|nr:Epoxide hydrolase A [Fusarium oxysporum f. sp. raphani]
MDSFTKKIYTTSRSLSYTYYDSAPGKPVAAHKPTLLFLHGFPDSAYVWKEVVYHLRTLPHRIILPDLLGFGGSSKPTDPTVFKSNAMAADLAELLVSEGVSKVIVIGHDAGSFLAQRMWLWQPQLIVGVALLNVAYMPPFTVQFDLTTANAYFEKATGLPRYAYWEFLTADDGGKVIDAHLESFWAALHGSRQGWMRDMFCVRGAMRDFLEMDGRTELRDFAKPGKGWKEDWMKAVTDGGGLASALSWYKVVTDNYQYEVEKTLSPERAPITVPTLFIGCTGDEVALPEMIEENKQAGLVPHVEIKVLDCGHWCMMEKPDDVAEALLKFLSEHDVGTSQGSSN